MIAGCHVSRELEFFRRYLSIDEPGDRREDIFLDDRQDFQNCSPKPVRKQELPARHFGDEMKMIRIKQYPWGMRWLLSAYTIRLNHRRKLACALATAARTATAVAFRGCVACGLPCYETPSAEDHSSNWLTCFRVLGQGRVVRALLNFKLLHFFTLLGGDGFVEIGHIDLV